MAVSSGIYEVTNDRLRFARDVFLVVGIQAGQDVHADTELLGELGWDEQAVKRIGEGIRSRLVQGGCRVRPIADAEYALCDTLDELAELVWRHIATHAA